MQPKEGYRRYTVHLGGGRDYRNATWRLERLFGSGFRRLDAHACKHAGRAAVHVRDPYRNRKSLWLTPTEWAAAQPKEV